MLDRLDNRDYLAGIFILFGAALRFYGFSDWSLSNDELSAISRTNFNSFSELINKGIWVDGHPALVQIFEYYWIQLFGNSVFVVRLPFVLLSVGSCIYFYRLLTIWLNKNAALFGLALFIPSYIFVLYAQIARPYAAGLFFTMAFSFYFFRMMKFGEVKKNALGIIGFGLAASLTHYFSTLGTFLIYFSAIVYLNKRNAKGYFGLATLMLVLYLPHLPITLNHLSIGGVSWLAKPEADFLERFMAYFFQNSYVLGVVICASLLLLLVKRGLHIEWRPLFISLFVFFASFYIAYYYSITKTPVLQFSVLLFTAPFLLSFLASFIGRAAQPKFIIGVSSLLLLVSSFSLISGNSFYSKKPFANFKAVAENSVQWTNELGSKNVLSIANSSNTYYLKYYTEKVDSNFNYTIDQVDEANSIVKIRNIITNSSKDFLLIAYANTIVPAEIHEFAKQKYSIVSKHKRYFNSDVILYSKSSIDRKAHFSASYLTHPNWDVNKRLLQDSVFYSDSLAFHQNPKTEYALTYRDTLKNLVQANANCLTISAQLLSKNSVEVNLVLSVSRADSTVYWRGTSVAPYYEENKWSQFLYVFQKPDDLLPSDLVTIYFWNPKKQNLYIDEFKMYNFADSDYNYYEF